LKRLPIRFNYNDNYYTSREQGIPEDAYTEIVARILDHENISVHLNTPLSKSILSDYDHIVYTGALDEFFDYEFGRLSYRTVFWNKDIYSNDEIGHAAMNYPSESVPFTRRREHKFYKYWKTYDKTVVFTEFSKATTDQDEPFYPMRLPDDKETMYKYYDKLVEQENMSFVGRLALYKYQDMHQVILDALELADQLLYSIQNKYNSLTPKVPPRRQEEVFFNGRKKLNLIRS
jgi:UDP-galactopyranose mutase